METLQKIDDVGLIARNTEELEIVWITRYCADQPDEITDAHWMSVYHSLFTALDMEARRN